jgi:glycosyltransferase involved in cell wall biosynthesis
LEGLRNQTRKDFEVVIIFKPSGDETTKIVNEYRNCLNIVLVLQSRGSLVDALNLGIEHAHAEIIACLDDDAVPFPNWIESYVEAYKDSGIGGIAGNVLPVVLREKVLVPSEGQKSEILLEHQTLRSNSHFAPWRQPIEGLEHSLIYISRAGLVEYNSFISSLAWRQPVESLLGMGANMSFLVKGLGDVRLPSSWILGLSNEQYLAWILWRRGYKLLFDPAIAVRHIHHGQSLSRNIKQKKLDLLRRTEYNLLFYRLYGNEPRISIMHRLTWLIFDAIVNIKKYCVDRDISQMARLKSKFYSESIGLKWLLSKKLGLHYSVLLDLEKLAG